MARNIKLEIYTPEKTALNKNIYRVVLPYGNTNLTIIEDRAPTSLVLHAGPLKILSENNQIEDLYFIDGGVVDVAQNVCKISVCHIIHRRDISIEQAKGLAVEEPQNAVFYKMIADYINAFETKGAK
ncbi:MAG: hypothetical protein J6N49_06150 [Alphaproteobacteria bacterium]|nr:hypothetical protein [Alphaproteobacteria bacterium]